MPESDLDLLKGTLDVMILKTLSWGPMHGFGVARWIRETTKETLFVEDSALYPALHRMEHRGWIDAEWGITENSRRAKYYRLTAAGRAHLKASIVTWDRYARAVTRVIHATQQPA